VARGHCHKLIRDVNFDPRLAPFRSMPPLGNAASKRLD
jgi:hypothetical protein